MIITDPPLDSKSTANYGATTESTSSHSPMGIPSVATSSLNVLPGMPPPYYRYQIQEKSSKRRTWLRLLLAFLAAVSLYILTSAIVRSLSSAGLIPDIFEGEALYPSPADGNILQCYRKDLSDHISDTPEQVFFSGGYAYKQSLSYSIPASSDLIYFLSRGNHGHGSLNFVVAESDDDNVKVDILVEYNRPKLFEKTNICLLTRNSNERGVGFFTPRRLAVPSRDSIRFTVVVKFPQRSDGPLLINGLDTHMGIWKQSLSLDNLVKFNRIGLRSSNTPIGIDNALIKDGDFRTTNGPITGSFTTYGRLVLKTTNSPININLIMKNVDQSRATEAELETSNGFIQAFIALASGLGSDQPATFTVKAETSNSPLTLSFPSAPTSPFAILNLEGSTSNSPVKTTLHPTFEGHVVLQSTIFSPTLDQHYVKDPSGQDRVRVINTERTTGRGLSANVKWGEDSPPGRGTISLKTTNSPNVLYLDDFGYKEVGKVKIAVRLQ